MSIFKPPLDRFQGCLVGALIGDCLGAPFENTCFAGGIPKERIVNTINPEKMSTKENGSRKYTDDTAMTKSICSSLLHCNKFDSVDMANRFTKSFFNDKNRGYGGGVRDVFSSWANNGINYENVYLPSTNQFDGSGSYGNGGAMRVAPVAMFATSLEACVDIAKQSATLTHSHRTGYNGTILQSLAVYKALYTEHNITWKTFLQELVEEMNKVEETVVVGDTESTDDDLSDEDKLYEWTRSNTFSYTKQLHVVEELLTKHYENKNDNDVDCVINLIGRDITAAQAVPAAIYCFLRNLDASVEETLYYTLSLGGDTDTIATMCMAMVGAHRGYDALPQSWNNVCESHEEMKTFAGRFHELNK